MKKMLIICFLFSLLYGLNSSFGRVSSFRETGNNGIIAVAPQAKRQNESIDDSTFPSFSDNSEDSAGIVQLSSNTTFSVFVYSFYRMDDYCDIPLYVADIVGSSNAFPTYGLVNLVLCYEHAKPILIVDYSKGEEVLRYTMLASSATESYILSNYIQIDGNDFSNKKVSQLLTSLNFRNDFLLSKVNNEIEISENSVSQRPARVASNGNSSVDNCTDYLEYTSYDSLLQKYVSDSSYRETKRLSGNANGYDNPVVQLIPKELFIHSGQKLCIGPEYGFYIKTAKDSNRNVSSFLLFDVSLKKLSKVQVGSVSISPVYDAYASYDSSTGLVNASYGAFSTRLAIAEIGVDLQLQNNDHKNPWESGYDPYGDYGYAFSSYSLTARGSVKNSSNPIDTEIVDIASKAISFIPVIGENISKVIDIAVDVLNYVYSHSPYPNSNYDLTKTSDGSFILSNTFLNAYTNTNTMIQERGELIKSIACQLVTAKDTYNKEDPLLYKAKSSGKSDLFEVAYNKIQKNADVNWNSTLTTAISLKIVKDNTLTSNSLDTLTSGQIVFQHFVNEFPTASSITIYEGDSPKGIELVPGGVQTIYFTPYVSGNYLFETFGSDYRTVLSLYSSANNLLSENNDGGSYENSASLHHCSEITCYLSAGQKYHFTLHNYSTSEGGYTYFLATRFGPTLSEATTPSVITGDSNTSNYYKWYKFVPTRSSVYTFTGFGNAGLALTLYNWQMDIISRGLYINGGNETIHAYLEKGYIYYLQVKVCAYDDDDDSFSYKISVYNEEPTRSDLSSSGAITYSHTSYLDTSRDSCVYYPVTGASGMDYEVGVESVFEVKYFKVILLDSNFNILHTYYSNNGKISIAHLKPEGKRYYVYIGFCDTASHTGYFRFTLSI